ncbi:MAG TPA: SRPBCC family protein [Allosphingosinicella sp.]|jgi:uncharacterized protein YndB with AHSA1/START domain
MKPNFTVFAHVSRPPEEVFEAVADPGQLSRYFTTGGAEGRLETGAIVSWEFHDFPGAFPVEVVEAEPSERIVLRWAAADDGSDGYSTTVTFAFEPTEDGRTKVSVAEEGWRETDAGLAASYGNCMGWSQMLCALKVWLEHGINLREAMYR